MESVSIYGSVMVRGRRKDGWCTGQMVAERNIKMDPIHNTLVSGTNGICNKIKVTVEYYTRGISVRRNGQNKRL